MMGLYQALLMFARFFPIVSGGGLIRVALKEDEFKPETMLHTLNVGRVILVEFPYVVTPKERPETSPDILDALCCSPACSTCPGPQGKAVDRIRTKIGPLCKCDSLCVSYGDCCPGYSDRCLFGIGDRSTPWDELECVRTSNALTQLYKDKYGFYMVSKCPWSKDWGAYNELCRAHRSNFTKIAVGEVNDIMGMLPVASKITGLHYKNIHCALCNGVPADSLVPWVARSDERVESESEEHIRFWFEPPDAPSLGNITYPRDCSTGVDVSDADSQNSSVAQRCSEWTNVLDSDMCLTCSRIADTPRCYLPPWSWFDVDVPSFKIPFNFPSFVQNTVQPYPCPDSFSFDPDQRKCARNADSIGMTRSTKELLCLPLHSELRLVWLRLQFSSLLGPSPLEVIHQDVRSAFRETFAAADPSVETDSLLHRRWSWLIPTEESGAISFKVQLTLNASTEHLLGATAEDLLANLGVNRSYLASAIEYMLPCGKYAIEQCDPESGLTEVQDDDITLSNGTLILNMTKKELQFSTLLKKVGYDLEKSEGGNVVSETIQLFICNIKGHTKSGQAQQLLYLIGTVVSLVGLLLTFITYAILPGLRTVPGLGTMNLIAATFMAQLGLLVAGQAASIVHPVLCTALAAFLHYVWLASFSWTSCLALGLSQAFGSPIGMKRQQRSRVSTAKLNALYGWGTPGLIVAACLAAHFAGHQSGALLVYGGDITCWIHPKKANLVVFGVPVMLSLMANIGMFARAVRGVRASKATTKCLKADVSFAQRARQEMVIYVKVSLLMGFSWLWALLGSFTNIDAFWFVFIIFNSFQGAYIFVAFVCNSRVLRILRARLRGNRLDQPRAVRQTTRRERNGRRMPSSSNKTRSSNGS